MQTIISDFQPCIVGLGKTGVSLLRYFIHRVQQGDVIQNIYIIDDRENPKNGQKIPAIVDTLPLEKRPQIHIHFGSLHFDWMQRASDVYWSPGLAIAPYAKALAERNITPSNDINLFGNFAKNAGIRVIAITASNGKSTVVEWVAHVCKKLGMSVVAIGNNGNPVCQAMIEYDNKPFDIAIIELSSFQLELCTDLHSDVSAILNISADHQERYADMSAYYTAKQRIHNKSKCAVYNRDDNKTLPILPQGGRFVSFGLSEADINQFGLLKQNQMQYLAQGHQRLLPTHVLALLGQHNIANALAVLAICAGLGVTGQQIQTAAEALIDFYGLPHRCQIVGNGYQNIRFINDSKGTNVGATVAAISGLAQTDCTIILLCGGDTKDADFSELAKVIRQYTCQVYAYGKNITSMIADLAIAKEYVYADLRAAFTQAFADAKNMNNNVIILLSPACASYDQFENFEQRGSHFCDLVALFTDPELGVS